MMANKRKAARKLVSFDRRGRYLAVSIRRDVMVRFDRILLQLERLLGIELSRSDALSMVLQQFASTRDQHCGRFRKARMRAERIRG